MAVPLAAALAAPFALDRAFAAPDLPQRQAAVRGAAPSGRSAPTPCSTC